MFKEERLLVEVDLPVLMSGVDVIIEVALVTNNHKERNIVFT